MDIKPSFHLIVHVFVFGIVITSCFKYVLRVQVYSSEFKF